MLEYILMWIVCTIISAGFTYFIDWSSYRTTMISWPKRILQTGIGCAVALGIVFIIN